MAALRLNAGFASVDFSGFARFCLRKVPCLKGEVIRVMLREFAITNVSAFAQNPTTVFVDHQRKCEMVSFFVYNFNFYIANLSTVKIGVVICFCLMMRCFNLGRKQPSARVF